MRACGGAAQAQRALRSQLPSRDVGSVVAGYIEAQLAGLGLQDPRFCCLRGCSVVVLQLGCSRWGPELDAADAIGSGTESRMFPSVQSTMQASIASRAQLQQAQAEAVALELCIMGGVCSSTLGQCSTHVLGLVLPQQQSAAAAMGAARVVPHAERQLDPGVLLNAVSTQAGGHAAVATLKLGLATGGIHLVTERCAKLGVTSVAACPNWVPALDRALLHRPTPVQVGALVLERGGGASGSGAGWQLEARCGSRCVPRRPGDRGRGSVQLQPCRARFAGHRLLDGSSFDAWPWQAFMQKHPPLSSGSPAANPTGSTSQRSRGTAAAGRPARTQAPPQTASQVELPAAGRKTATSAAPGRRPRGRGAMRVGRAASATPAAVLPPTVGAPAVQSSPASEDQALPKVCRGTLALPGLAERSFLNI